MRKIFLLSVISASFALAACNPFAPKCSHDQQTVDAVYADATYQAELDQVTALRGYGYTCTTGATIRNAFGTQIGQTYVCTKC
jgi:hypothetical protein